jgi:hypothetical protein
VAFHRADEAAARSEADALFLTPNLTPIPSSNASGEGSADSPKYPNYLRTPLLSTPGIGPIPPQVRATPMWMWCWLPQDWRPLACCAGSLEGRSLFVLRRGADGGCWGVQRGGFLDSAPRGLLPTPASSGTGSGLIILVVGSDCWEVVRCCDELVLVLCPWLPLWPLTVPSCGLMADGVVWVCWQRRRRVWRRGRGPGRARASCPSRPHSSPLTPRQATGSLGAILDHD